LFNNKLLFLLAINIAVLSLQIGYFFTSPQLPSETRQHVHPSVMLRSLLSVIETSHDHVTFPFMDSLSSTEGQEVQLNKAIQNKSDKRLLGEQKILKQQVNRLNHHNQMLQQEVILLNQQLADEKTQAIIQAQQITQLKQRFMSSPGRLTEVELVRESIQKQPDLIHHRGIQQGAVTQSQRANNAVEHIKYPERLTGSIEFGFAYEQDNQVTQSINGRLLLDYDKREQYNIHNELDFEFEDEDGEMSTAKYRWQLQSDYHLDLNHLVFVRSDMSRSKFSSYDKENIFTVGYGRVFFDNPKHKFNLEIGPGYRFAVPNVGEDAVSIDEFIVRTRLNYERVINESLQLKMDSVLEKGDSNSVYNMSFKAQNRLYQQLYLIFDFTYKFTQNVPIDTVNEEASSGLSLLYAF